MRSDDNEGLNLALDILKSHQQQFEEIARKAVTDFELEQFEVVMICGHYDLFWKEFIDALNPHAEVDAARLLKEGLMPISISITTREGFASYLTEISIDISVPETTAGTDKVWLLILHQKGHTWLPLSATAPPKLNS